MTKAPGAARFWWVLVPVHLGFSLILTLINAPSPFLFGGVLAGLVCVNAGLVKPDLPPLVRPLGLAVLGAGAGIKVDADVAHAVAEAPWPILGGVVATIAVTLLAGQVLRLSPHVDTPTAMLASIAGGAASVATIARELGADQAMVLAVQYLRVLFVLSTVPIVATWAGVSERSSASAGDAVSTSQTVAFLLIAVVVGMLLARLLPFGGSGLILPLLVSAGLSVSGVLPKAVVPGPVLDYGFSVAGLAVGLVLSRRALRKLASVMPLAFVQLTLTIGGCVAIGLLIAEVVGISKFDGYLATAPGGLPLVTAVAISSGGAVGLIVTMQVIRLALAIMLAPIIAALFRPRGGGTRETAP